ncbi:methionine ABC transporter ATP-binding protein MetN [Phocoenobacter skyensis]|uniref:D-methionine transport system ATP-binding protein n=1 Tax=Phocoenobacter skyensis TaxID=97481 RepID=A0A1H7WFB0_9PAST|nr:methionine ABC transporter ATP-binding protein MetN [Pasteurella skyensis]MDP8079206.1 methionine ABC transporter ATP-binding protein MetN [Pasteurella skyensis]MDP8085184.1 methionine ABC transporter ATP-binding protein MetN [Pasteurella skyensis]MDP8162148.1 methionine ABC transporter ATP-binding protein MetN [Pasteurella skyensis]MDP8170005.1 methionine ABC transporter ATP-binding protein MetN [Pasteurella skyensis]MDP8175900.1 methionine ABC transporter ATP-binding protein MetN [Pasteur
MIRLERVSKQFEVKGKIVTALHNVTLEVPKGVIYGVIGSSGAGKSTLIRCVNLLERPTSGHIFIGNKQLDLLKEQELIVARRKIAMIFQHFNLLSSRTVFDNVALPLELSHLSKEQINNKVNDLLELVGLSDKKNVYPSNLSGGQKQRVAIARALANDPEVLLCDEATSALDPATTQSILALLKEINSRLGLTILLITHEMEVVKRICDRVAVIDQGELVETGTVSEMFSNPKTQLAKQFIQSTFHNKLPQEYVDKLHSNQQDESQSIIRFEFTGSSVDAPLLSRMVKKFDIDISILMSQIDYAGGVKFGFVIAEVEGDNQAILEAKGFLREHNVKVEVLGYVE